MFRMSIPNGIPCGTPTRISQRSPKWDPKAGSPVTVHSKHLGSCGCLLSGSCIHPSNGDLPSREGCALWDWAVCTCERVCAYDRMDGRSAAEFGGGR